MKSGNLNFLEPPGPLQACNGTALPLRHLAMLWLQDPYRSFTYPLRGIKAGTGKKQLKSQQYCEKFHLVSLKACPNLTKNMVVVFA